jgi:hypothetical protein
MSSRVVLFFLLLTFVLGCENAGPATDRYVLFRTQAGELPALLGERDGCRHEVIGGWLELQDGNRYQANLQRTANCGGSMAAAVDTTVDEGSGTYEVIGDSIRFVYDAGVSAGMGAWAGDTLVVVGPGQTLYYRRGEDQ